MLSDIQSTPCCGESSARVRLMTDGRCFVDDRLIDDWKDMDMIYVRFDLETADGKGFGASMLGTHVHSLEEHIEWMWMDILHAADGMVTANGKSYGYAPRLRVALWAVPSSSDQRPRREFVFQSSVPRDPEIDQKHCM
jgi:hypothetical protein